MTARGWSVLFSAVVLWLAGRLFGVGELIQLSLVVGTLCLLSLAHVLWGRHHLTVERRLSSQRVHRGQSMRVDLVVSNPHRLQTPLVHLVEELPAPLGTYLFSITVEPRKQRAVSYSLWPERRGLFTLPPPKTFVGDPFGLARRAGSHGSPSTLIVYPRIEELASPEGMGARFLRGSRARRVPAPAGEDFYRIRDYVPGDDRRKVHWKSTARMGSLMVREDESVGLPRVTIFLDDREKSHRVEGQGPTRPATESFEWAVEAAASVVALYSQRQFAMRVTRAAGQDIPLGRGAEQYHRVLEALAVAHPGKGSDVKLRSLSHAGHEGILVAVMGAISPSEARVLAAASRGFEDVIVFVPPSVPGSPDMSASIAFLRTTLRLVHPAPGEALSDAWIRSIWGRSWTGAAI